MPEDASLDQFASPGATETDSEDARADSEDGGAVPENSRSDSAETGAEAATGDAPEDDADSESLDASAVEPAVSTYRWSSDGGECADCGASAERLWRGEGQTSGDLVCPDCKEW